MKFGIGEMIWIVIIAFVGVWAIDKGLNMTGLKSFAINNS